MQILTYEIPMLIPENDLGDLSDKNTIIQNILQWNPDTSKYDIYKNELISNGHDFTLFKKQHSELSNYEYGKKKENSVPPTVVAVNSIQRF